MWLSFFHKSIIKTFLMYFLMNKKQHNFCTVGNQISKKNDTYVTCWKEKQIISSEILRSKTSFWRLYPTASEWVNFLLPNLVFIERIYRNLPELLMCKDHLYIQWFSSKISSAVTSRGNHNTYLFYLSQISVLANSAYWQTKHRNFKTTGKSQILNIWNPTFYNFQI